MNTSNERLLTNLARISHRLKDDNDMSLEGLYAIKFLTDLNRKDLENECTYIHLNPENSTITISSWYEDYHDGDICGSRQETIRLEDIDQKLVEDLLLNFNYRYYEILEEQLREEVIQELTKNRLDSFFIEKYN